MASNEIVIRFEDVSFEYSVNKPILNEVTFTVRRGSKVTVMGQNGAGKSTIFKMIGQHLKPNEGEIHLAQKLTIAEAPQVMPRGELGLTLREFFEKRFKDKVYDIDPRIDEVLNVVNLKSNKKLHDKKIKDFSGGQQARILLASAIIQKPDILLLDEPTNNLDKEGVAHLTEFLKNYRETVVVISHDSEFLNSFTDAVLYLDIFTKKVEQYAGNYFDVMREITARIERENQKNARLQKTIQQKKDQSNVFAHKGGKLRLVARRMKELAEELEEQIVDVRKEDKAIRAFHIPAEKDLPPEIITFSQMSFLRNHKIVNRNISLALRKRTHLLIKGPNGVGKTTLLESIAHSPDHKDKGIKLSEGVHVGYYRQDFSTLDFNQTVFDCLNKVAIKMTEHEIRSVAAGFHITGEIMHTKIGSLSEGQKGLVAFAQLVIEKPGLLILDEPTNHINFRHLPVIAKALDEYQGAMILVSHVPDFVEQIRIDETIDLAKL
ncbi:MAG: ABC-F family ATP-binding cassette domain-containing protein [bacterium]|nr:ABC-F family ATP-binding cassette domain-containing protein [bacterium]